MNPPKISPKGFSLVVLVIVITGYLLFFAGIYLRNYYLPKIFPGAENKPDIKGVVNSPYVSAIGTQLYLNGKPFKFTGFNNYSLATLWGTNAGCGGQNNDPDGFFSSLRPDSVVRMWAFQGSMATNVQTKQI